MLTTNSQRYAKQCSFGRSTFSSLWLSGRLWYECVYMCESKVLSFVLGFVIQMFMQKLHFCVLGSCLYVLQMSSGCVVWPLDKVIRRTIMDLDKHLNYSWDSNNAFNGHVNNMPILDIIGWHSPQYVISQDSCLVRLMIWPYYMYELWNDIHHSCKVWIPLFTTDFCSFWAF